ncbi:hypothetical protein BP5796_09602 [Coleophoma crateriformis]|uniref:SWIRM domain-containing protein n=1 Tax=Coleophoma crateriformis TaxID=565419 RepID=A0A3D8QYF4_9HELO|nr:hypothetical protein BP5796_09602 [Coleophoma crateriformis]
MADKTTNSLQPSTTFESGLSPITHSRSAQWTSTSTPSSSSINSTPRNMENKYQFDMRSSLMSPPEALPLESFSRASTTPQKTMYSKPMGRFPLSPPVSPLTKATGPDDTRSATVKDPILYPQQDSQITPQPPLFEDDSLVTQSVVDGHVAARGSLMFREASPPRPDEYQLVLEFKSRVAKAYNANRNLWFKRERQFLLEDRAIQSRRYRTLAPQSPNTINIGSKRGQAIKTPRNTIKAAKVVKPPRAAPVKPHRATTPGEGKTARTDKDFASIPDYCPPISSLPNKPNSLKVDWRGAPIDLSADPYFTKLHPDERLLAANLRLDCATYLTSKRRIFERRLECLRIGKEFRKTDAQQACKIDVNKASKLWQAFDKVGWLDKAWVAQFR